MQSLNASQTKVFSFRPSSLSPLLPHLTVGSQSQLLCREVGGDKVSMVSPLQPQPHAAHAASHTTAERLCSLQPIQFAVDPAPNSHSFVLHAIPGAGKGRLELLSEEQPHLVLLSVFTHSDCNLASNPEDDDKPQKQQFKLVKPKQIL